MRIPEAERLRILGELAGEKGKLVIGLGPARLDGWTKVLEQHTLGPEEAPVRVTYFVREGAQEGEQARLTVQTAEFSTQLNMLKRPTGLTQHPGGFLDAV